MQDRFICAYQINAKRFLFEDSLFPMFPAGIYNYKLSNGVEKKEECPEHVCKNCKYGIKLSQDEYMRLFAATEIRNVTLFDDVQWTKEESLAISKAGMSPYGCYMFSYPKNLRDVLPSAKEAFDKIDIATEIAKKLGIQYAERQGIDINKLQNPKNKFIGFYNSLFKECRKIK